MLIYSALVDASTAALLALSTNVPIICFLAKATPEAEHIAFVNYPNYMQRFELAASPKTFPEWSWNRRHRRFLPMPNPTDDLRQRSLLALKKAQALFEITLSLNMLRYPVANGLGMQETVYITKKMQAQRYKDAGCPKEPLAYPYVLQYSEHSGLTMRAAADEILFKAQLDDEVLLKTEGFRLKYFNLLKDIIDVAQLDPLIHDFRRELFRGE